jgi:uncharacterized protein YciI
MRSEPGMYLLNCTVDPVKRDQLAKLRASHIAHIISNQDKIIYAGVIGSADKPPLGILVILQANSLTAARAIARADPYARTYSSISVSEFQQRIPEKYQDQLADILGALNASAGETPTEEIASR